MLYVDEHLAEIRRMFSAVRVRITLVILIYRCTNNVLDEIVNAAKAILLYPCPLINLKKREMTH